MSEARGSSTGRGPDGPRGRSPRAGGSGSGGRSGRPTKRTGGNEGRRSKEQRVEGRGGQQGAGQQRRGSSRDRDDQDDRRGSRDRGGAGDRRGSGDRPRRGSAGDPDAAGPAQWGSLGRKGAGRVARTGADQRHGGTAGRDDRPDPGNEEVRWERVDVRDDATAAVRRSRDGGSSAGRSTGAGSKGGDRSGRSGGRGGAGADRRTRGEARRGADDGLEPKERRGRAARNPGAGSGGAEARDELIRALGAQKGGRANQRLRDAAHAFERERFDEARSLLRPIAEAAPQAAAVRELLGLTYYRLGRWSDAVRELEAFRELERTTEQHPVLADCYRALNRRREVEDLWDELREVSPAPDLVTEGRIVMAGSLADQGRLAEAIALLERSQRSVKRPAVHHLRQAYALADLYERAGEIARAREVFRWVVDHEPGFADAAERAASLG